MVRVPRGLTSPVGAYSPGFLRWSPNVRPIRRIPIQAYRQPISQVPLAGGQAQGVIPSGTASGSAASPTAFQILATLPIPAGPVTLAWSVTLAGTVGGADANNFALRVQSGPTLAVSVNAGAVGTYPQATVTVTGPAQIQLETFSSAPTAGSTYSGTFTISLASLTLSVGPGGYGNIWYPASATVSTTTGVFDSSTASIYLGPAGIPITLLGAIYTGNGVLSAALPPMAPGQYLITVWTSAHPGDTAAVNIVGTMDSVSV